jgi:hypothetical protein
MHAVDGIISNAPGPIDLLTRCSGNQNTINVTCNKIRVGFGSTAENPSAYDDVSLKNFLSGTLSPALFTQALDDITGNAFGVPQVENMQNIVQAGLNTCTNCEDITFNYYETGGHAAFVTNTVLQNDIRTFVGSFIPENDSGSRVILYNWYQHNEELGLGSNGTYVYPTGSNLHNGDDNHGMHVAGTVVGNSQGWARDANIYMISPYSSNPNTLASENVFDYIRAFHKNKPINPLTGRKNPTICNNSWGSFYGFTRSNITNINWRGTNYTNNFTDANLRSYGIVDFDANTIYVQAWTTALVADVEDTINDGIILVGAAGNESSKIDTVGGIDYNNTITGSNSFTTPYHRGSWNTVGGNAICVGSISLLTNESKATYSNCGPRVDIYSPGNEIISSLHTAGSGTTRVNDFRNSIYKVGKLQGTSMASPQVCGVLACLLEQYPNFNQNNAVDYLNNTVKENQITDTAGGYTDNTSLQGSNNNYLYYKKERIDSGTISPKVNRNIRANSGQVYPRTNMVTYAL